MAKLQIFEEILAFGSPPANIWHKKRAAEATLFQTGYLVSPLPRLTTQCDYPVGGWAGERADQAIKIQSMSICPDTTLYQPEQERQNDQEDHCLQSCAMAIFQLGLGGPHQEG
jgi:hypothetical protein